MMKRHGKKSKKSSDAVDEEFVITKRLKKCDDMQHNKSLASKGILVMKPDDNQNTECSDTDDEEILDIDEINNQRPPLSKVGRLVKEIKIRNSGLVPKSGSAFKNGQTRAAGNYYLGPILGSSPVRSMVQCLGRKKETDEFYTLKILTIRETNEETQDDKQGKMLLHTEHSLLSFLNGQPGIIKEHGLFEDYASDAISNNEGKSLVNNGKIVRRICLVLDCVIPHAFNTESCDYINLQHYVIGKRKLIELDALIIFYNIVSVVKNLHDLNVIHRDLKLANLVLNKRNRQIILTNFCLGQHLVSEDDKLLDQRGSPAYISPDVLIGKPYLGKPSDMWALGVVLFTMLYGQFPFYHKYHQELFKMIKTAQYTIPNDGGVKTDTLDVIQNLLCLDPLKRSTASQILTKLTSVIIKRLTPETFASHDAQVVPDLPEFSDDLIVEVMEEEDEKKKKLPALEGEEIVKDSHNILDYLLQRTVPHPEISTDKKTTLSLAGPNSLPRGNLNYCYSTVRDDSHSSSPKSGSTISIIEGDLRTFSQSDLFTHRSIFPHYSGPDLFGGWRNPSSVPPPPSSSGSSPAASRSLPRIGISGTVRMPSSRLNLPSIHIPTSNNSPNLYEFPPARRWALAVLQQIHNNPNAKPPVVPQLEFNVPENSTPSSSGVSSGVSNEVPKHSSSLYDQKIKGISNTSLSLNKASSGTPNEVTEPIVSCEPKIKGILANKVASPRPSCSGVSKKVTFMAGNRNFENEREEPGPSKQSSDMVLDRDQPSACYKARYSSLALRRIKNRSKTRLSSKSSASLRLRMIPNYNNNFINNGYNDPSNAGSSSSSSNGNIDGNSNGNSGNDTMVDSNMDEESINPLPSNFNANFSSLCGMNQIDKTNRQEYMRIVDIEELPTDDNNNNDEVNNNSDNNNNSENHNLNITNTDDASHEDQTHEEENM